jgi:phospholipid transport system substrate-binding protein
VKYRHTVSAFLLAVPLGAFAATPEAAPIETLNHALIATMKAGSAKIAFQARYDALAPVVKQVLNLPVILQNSVGFRWPAVPAAQREELEQVFEQYTVASYVSGFSGYSGQTIEVLATEKALGAKKIVESQITPAAGGAPVRLDYVMTEGEAGWQVTDVLLDSTISKVAVQSSEFRALVKQGDVSPLIAALKAKVAVLSDGALKD